MATVFSSLKKLPFFKGFSWVVPVMAFVGLSFALYKVISYTPAPKHSPLVMPPESPVQEPISGIGVVEPCSTFINISTELGGVARKVSVLEGDDVKAGDLLLSLDTRDIDAQIDVLEKQLAVATITAAQAGCLFDLVKKLKNDPAVSKDDFTRRDYAYRHAKAQVQQLKAQLRQARITRQRLHVRAPLDGCVLEVNVNEGEYVTPGMTTPPPILMGDVHQLYVRVDFDEEEVRHILKKNPAYGFTRDDSKTKIPLTFVRFEPHVQPKKNLAVAGQRVDTRVLQVLYALPEGISGIFTGQQVDVFVQRAERKQP